MNFLYFIIIRYIYFCIYPSRNNIFNYALHTRRAFSKQKKKKKLLSSQYKGNLETLSRTIKQFTVNELISNGKSTPCINSDIKFCLIAYLRFWYHVLTCVSVSCNCLARSILSCTLRYFCRSKFFSRVCSWWSVNAVRALRCFLLCELLNEFDGPFGSSSLPPAQKNREFNVTFYLARSIFLQKI